MSFFDKFEAVGFEDELFSVVWGKDIGSLVENPNKPLSYKFMQIFVLLYITSLNRNGLIPSKYSKIYLFPIITTLPNSLNDTLSWPILYILWFKYVT